MLMTSHPRVSSRATKGRHAEDQRGSSLIEVLVAVFIVSVGLLALAGILATATRFSKTSEFRSVASLLAADIADRMRANFNPGATAAQQGERFYTLQPGVLATAAPESDATCAVAAACTPEEMAQRDLAQWQAALFQALPQGTGFILPNATYDLFDIWVMWRDPDAEGTTVVGNATDDAATKDGCPPNFSDDQKPRCMHFRVGL